MHTYIAFLRAINVGGRALKMDHLREILESIDLKNVQSYIQSGNIIFQSNQTDIQQLEQIIESKLKNQLSFEVPALIRTKESLKKIGAFKPFSNEEIESNGKIYVSFLKSAPVPDLQKSLDGLSNETDQFKVHNTEVYWLTRTQISKSKYTNATIEKTLQTQATRRTINTIHKIIKKYLQD